MTSPASIAAQLRAHSALCEELLQLVERENQALRDPHSSSAFEFYQQRKQLLPRLNDSLVSMKQNRVDWQQLPSAEPGRQRRDQLHPAESAGCEGFGDGRYGRAGAGS